MKNLYDAPEMQIFEIKTDSEICGPSQGDVTNVPAGYIDDGGDLI